MADTSVYRQSKSLLAIEIRSEQAGIARLSEALAATGHRLPAARALVLNRVVTRARRKVVVGLAQDTGLYPKVLVRAVRMFRASAQNPRAGLVARGGEISLRYFKAREEGSGVAAEVAGERVFIAGGFRRSGRAPKRYLVKRLNGGVYVNPSRRWRGGMTREGSGVWIAESMIRGASLKAFDEVVANELPNEIARELMKIAPGGGRSSR